MSSRLHLATSALVLALSACGPAPRAGTTPRPALDAQAPRSGDEGLQTREIAGLSTLALDTPGPEYVAQLWFDAGGADVENPATATLAAWALGGELASRALPFALEFTAQGPELGVVVSDVLVPLGAQPPADMTALLERLGRARRAARSDPERDAQRRALVRLAGRGMDVLGEPGSETGVAALPTFVRRHLGRQRALLLVAGPEASALAEVHVRPALTQARDASEPPSPWYGGGDIAMVEHVAAFPIAGERVALARYLDAIDDHHPFPAPTSSQVFRFETPVGAILLASGPSRAEVTSYRGGAPRAVPPDDVAASLRRVALRWLRDRRAPAPPDLSRVDPIFSSCAACEPHPAGLIDIEDRVEVITSNLPGARVAVRFASPAADTPPGFAGVRRLAAESLANECAGQAEVDAEGWEVHARRTSPGAALAFARCVLAVDPQPPSGLRERLARAVSPTRGWTRTILSPRDQALLGPTRRGLLEGDFVAALARDRVGARSRVVIEGALTHQEAVHALRRVYVGMPAGEPPSPPGALAVPPSEAGTVHPAEALPGQGPEELHLAALWSASAPVAHLEAERFARSVVRGLAARGLRAQVARADGGAWGAFVWVELRIPTAREAEIGDLPAARAEVPTSPPSAFAAALRPSIRGGRPPRATETDTEGEGETEAQADAAPDTEAQAPASPSAASPFSALPHVFIGRPQPPRALRRSRRGSRSRSRSRSRRRRRRRR